MALARPLAHPLRLFHWKPVFSRASSNLSVHEPEYLKLLDPVNPVHEKLNIKIVGQDFTLVEHFQKYMHNVASQLGIKVSDSDSCKRTEARLLTSGQSDQKYTWVKVEPAYGPRLYRVEPPDLSILMEILRATLPEGVKVTFNDHKPEYEENRYIVDTHLLSMKRELEGMKGQKKK